MDRDYLIRLWLAYNQFIEDWYDKVAKPTLLSHRQVVAAMLLVMQEIEQRPEIQQDLAGLPPAMRAEMK